jgi:RimJ/RimL family protein N-acetyltransferase
MAASRTGSIYTRHLELLPMPAEFLEACLREDKCRADALIGFDVPRDWLDETSLIEARRGEFLEDPGYAIWGLRAVTIAASRTMIGHVGFHSLPNPDYLHPYWPEAVELAYTVYPPYRRMGHAFEAVLGLLRWAAAMAPIRQFLVSVAEDNAPSRGLAHKLGFVQAEEYIDDESRQIHRLYVLRGDVLGRLPEQRFKPAAHGFL